MTTEIGDALHVPAGPEESGIKRGVVQEIGACLVVGLLELTGVGLLDAAYNCVRLTCDNLH